MSKRKSAGYRQKREWLDARFAEGLKLHMIHEIGGRTVGFIEYIAGEVAWRAVHAPGYLVIHCLWVVGKGKGKGYGTHLIQTCLDDARAQGKHGVVMVTTDRVWLAKNRIFLKHGFEEVDQASPSFQLLVHRFGDAPLPSFPTDWGARQARYGAGLTVVRTPQCPYLDSSVVDLQGYAEEAGIPFKVVELGSAAQVQRESPSAYGVYGVVLDGVLLAYHYLRRKDLVKLIKTRDA